MTPPYAPPRRTWATRLREGVTERIGLKLIALLLAVLLWIVVHTRRPAERGAAVGVAPVVDGTGSAAPPSARPVVAPQAASDSTVAATP